MTRIAKQHIFFVDDEPNVRKAVSQTLAELQCKVSCFASAADCLEALRLQNCDLLITDVNMPGTDGIELLTQARQIRPLLPVLIVTGYGDIPLAVKAVKAGALDFIEKPLDEETFLPVVESALKKTTYTDPLTGQALTKTEIQILRFIADGKSNKEIAYLLHRAVRTVENHRHRLMRKLSVDNTAELVKLAITMGLVSS